MTCVLGQMNISNQISDIRVFDDKGDGVESELFKIDDIGIRSSLGLTDKRGYKQVYLLCKSEDQIGAIPGAIIGSISRGTTSSVSIEYGNDVLPKYYAPESSLR
tara:strand:- start:263 stop:574 length:312 start_codon:yes stop_codon:yes gene_type:complete